MKIEVNPDELAVVLDGLSALPLARSFNLFNRIMQQGLQEGVIKQNQPAAATPEVLGPAGQG